MGGCYNLRSGAPRTILSGFSGLSGSPRSGLPESGLSGSGLSGSGLSGSRLFIIGSSKNVI